MQIRSRDKHINNLKKKCQKESELKRENQQRIETLERYLADLPTLEDYQSQNKQVRTVSYILTGSVRMYVYKLLNLVCVCLLYQLLEAEQQVAQLQDKVRELEACLETTHSQLREKDTHMEDQKRRERDLLTTITEYVHTRCLLSGHANSNSNDSSIMHNLCFYFHLYQYAAAGTAGP